MILDSVIFVVISSVLVFLAIVLTLVAALLFARAKLTAVGNVKININSEREVSVNPGGTLLSTLSENGIFLPSACGGGGTCAQCRCQVIEGGGPSWPLKLVILPVRSSKTTGAWAAR